MSDASDTPICVPKSLPPELVIPAARVAQRLNPVNAIPAASIIRARAAGMPPLEPEHAALLTSAYWGPQGVHLTVGFLERVPSDFQQHVLDHANAWSRYGNVQFSLAPSAVRAQVRITVRGDGYWSYLGTGILTIPAGRPTLCLQDFDRGMPESEWRRVVRHEVGHTLGFPHEHARAEIVALLNPARTIAYFERTQGWSEDMIRQQILNPLPAGQIRGTAADVTSIMAYQFPGDCTQSGLPIPGGLDIDPTDGAFCDAIYPRQSGLKPMSPAEILKRIKDVL
jgi:hypothetical protein